MNFYRREDFACPCCGENLILDEVVTLANILVFCSKLHPRISSGYRCRRHNARIGGALNSAHILGKAMDVAISSSSDRRLYCSFCDRLGIVRLGFYVDHIHVDIDETKPAGWWVK